MAIDRSLRAAARGLFVGFAFLCAPVAAWSDDAERGRDLAIGECGACHKMGSLTEGGAGPALDGVVGRPAAAVADYPYSDAMKAAADRGVIWYRDDIKDYLVPDQTWIADTNMAYPGVPSQVDRDDIVAFLATLK